MSMRTGSARWLAAFAAVPVIAVAGGAGISADAGEGYTVTVLGSGASNGTTWWARAGSR